MDRISQKHRSWNMSRILGKHTRPEVAVRSLLHRHGYRFRLHRRDLPGKPDIVLAKYQTAVFVQGCFWHRHTGCEFAYTPKSNIAFWRTKFRENVARDKRNHARLRALGWQVLCVWECETREPERLLRRVSRALKMKRKSNARRRLTEAIDTRDETTN